MTGLDTLDEAIRCIESERQTVQSEADAFRAFREAVGRARPAGSRSGAGTSGAELAKRYRETVLSAAGYEETYGASLADSIEAELTPSTAATLLTDEALTQRQKRNLLQATNLAVDQREQFTNILAREHDSLVSIRANLRDILGSLEDLPPCSLDQLPFGDYLDVWHATTSLLERCDELLQDRQSALRATNRPVRRGSHGSHDLSEYLYANLPTAYPALHAITNTRLRVKRHREPANTMETDDHDHEPIQPRTTQPL